MAFFNLKMKDGILVSSPIESGGMGSYDVINVGFTWKRYKRCLVVSLSPVFSSCYFVMSLVYNYPYLRFSRQFLAYRKCLYSKPKMELPYCHGN